MSKTAEDLHGQHDSLTSHTTISSYNTRQEYDLLLSSNYPRSKEKKKEKKKKKRTSLFFCEIRYLSQMGQHNWFGIDGYYI